MPSPGRGELDEPDLLADRVVVVERETGLLGVEGDRAVERGDELRREALHGRIRARHQAIGQGLRVGEQVAQLRVAFVECLGEPGNPLHRVPQLWCGAGKSLRQGGQRVRQLVGVQPADRGGQVAEGVGQLVGRHRPLDRDGGGELAVPAGYDVEHLAAQQALGLYRRLGAIAQKDLPVDAERDEHACPVEFHAGHFSRGKTGDIDRGTGVQPAGVGEIGRILVGLVQEGEFLEVERGKDDGRDGCDADGPDQRGIAFGEGFHFGAHRPVLCPATLTYTGCPPFPLSFRIKSHR